MRCDVVVAGAGLAGLSAARDPMNQGTDVIVLEARNRPGGRVEQTTLADGRIVQLGGEVMGPFHHADLQLVDEVGLIPSFPNCPRRTYMEGAVRTGRAAAAAALTTYVR